MNSTMSCIGVPGRKTPLTPIAFSFGTSTSGMMPPITTSTSSSPFSLEQLHQPRRDVVVRAGQDRQADDVGVLLQRRRDDLLGRLAEAGVDDLHAGVAQRARDDLGAPVVPVEPRLGDDHSHLAHSSHSATAHSA